MDIVTSLHQDSIHGVINLDPEFPQQDSQKTCTRNSPCLQQGCMIGCTPNTQIHNLDVALNGSNASPTSPTTADRPQPPIDHTILILTAPFQENDIFELTSVDHQYVQAMKSLAIWSLRPPRSPENCHLYSTPCLPVQRPDPHTNCFTTLCQLQPPKLVTAKWSGQSYDF